MLLNRILTFSLFIIFLIEINPAFSAPKKENEIINNFLSIGQYKLRIKEKETKHALSVFDSHFASDFLNLNKTRPIKLVQLSPEEEMYKYAIEKNNVEDLKDFLKYFPDGKYAAVVRLRIKQIERGKLITSKEKNIEKSSSNREIGKVLVEITSSDGRYIDHGNGTITDNKTNLMWTKKDSYADLGECLDWNTSRSYVSSLTTGGYNDWRMPKVEELKSIYEKSKNNKTYSGDTIHNDPIFASGGGHYYWSSETKGSSRAREVFFHYGSAGDSRRDDCSNGGVRAVRR